MLEIATPNRVQAQRAGQMPDMLIDKPTDRPLRMNG